MHLKSLTLRGFKSFASSTTLQLEPGITCVVGPNGAGKSNVVDALAWVMGEQGVKSLRGGRMEDVVFAGTAGRAPLGRAEVVLTIDNTDGALPIDYTEVAITRTMFKGGGSEYALNGRSCRLLDVQELLSDSGIGREMHVVVGQGRLDSVLHATPEDRRGLVEEAAGVLKHRKRKEKALRKLDATEANLTRLADLLTELRRQLKPLGRQAEVARRAVQVQADVRDARARLLADDLVTARTALDRELADEEALRARHAGAQRDLDAARGQEAQTEQALRVDAPRLARAQETWYALSGLRERLRGTASLAAERARADDPVEGHRLGPDPETTGAEAGAVRAQEQQLAAELERQRADLEHAVAARRSAEDVHVAEERRVAELTRVAAGRREGLAHLHGRVHALRTRATAAEEEIARLTSAHEDALARAARAQHDFTALETRVAGLDAGEGGLDESYEAASAELRDLDDRLAKRREEQQTAERQRVALQARTEALGLALDRKDGAGALLGATDRLPGVLGSVAALVSVRPGYEAAVAAALGPAADAVAVADVPSALAALALLRSDDLGRSGLVLGAEGPDAAQGQSPSVPAGTVAAVDAVEAPAALRPALSGLLRSVVVVESLDRAVELRATRPELTAVTAAGELLGRHVAAGGSASAPSLLETQAALEETRERLADAGHACERLRFELAGLEEERADARGRADAALARLHESDASMAAVAEQLGQLGASARSARAEGERLSAAVADAEQARDRDLSGLADLEVQAADAEQSPEDEPDDTDVRRLAEAAAGARSAELEARLALRTSEERARALEGRAEGLERAAADAHAARERAQARRERRLREVATARSVVAAAEQVVARLELSLAAAAEQRRAVEQAREEREQLAGELRARVRALESELAGLVDSVHRDELARAQQRLRVEALEERAREDLGVDPESLVEEYGPDLPVPVPASPDAAEDEPVPDPVPYDREQQRKRLASAEKSLALLGTVNPLALEEYAALEERHAFLSEQLDDLRRTRGDLLDIVRDVDDRVQQVFSEAYADVEREFAGVFERLFPGGEGRLLLTEPDDLLATGIEVEARPPGKKVKRLSLLSGGERSLVAVAFLVALFKARPSPFYILDEVEAALDDTNLGRLLTLYEELRATSQLVVVTHQKRTMEIADALYGVSMRGDGVSVVVGQRLREPV